MFMKLEASVNLSVTYDKEIRKEQCNPICHICNEELNAETHILEWSIFGCKALLRLLPEERINELRRQNICYNCGERRVTETCPHPRDHKCIMISKDIECYEENCNWNGFTCRHKEFDPDVGRKVLDKFGLDLPNVSEAQDQDKEVVGNPDPRAMPYIDKAAEIPQSSTSIQHRINDLQSGAVSKQMSDNEIKEWFQIRE